MKPILWHSYTVQSSNEDSYEIDIFDDEQNQMG